MQLADEFSLDVLTHTNRIIGYRGRRIKILVVDDNADNRAVLAGLLEPLGFLIAEAEDGQAGLIQTLSWQPDVILTDLVMPKLDGFSLIRQLRQLPAYTDTIIIAASASVLEADIQHSLDIGSNSFLPKPVQAEVLRKQLEQLLHLEWVYAERPSDNLSTATPTEIVYPPATTLDGFYTAARQGNMTAILHHLHTLEQTADRQYQPFIHKIRQYSDEFHLDEIADWLASIDVHEPRRE